MFYTDTIEILFFCFTRIRLNRLDGQVLHHDCISMIVSRFTTFTENFVICHCTSTSSARCPCSGRECKRCAYPSPVPLLLATPLVIHEKNWKCLDPQAQGFPVAPKGQFLSTKFSLNSCSQSGNSCNGSLCTSTCPSFLFVFLISVNLCSGFPSNSSLIHLLLSVAGFSVSADVKFRILR